MSSLTMASVLALSELRTAAPRLYDAVRMPPVKTFSKLSVASSASPDILRDVIHNERESDTTTLVLFLLLVLRCFVRSLRCSSFVENDTAYVACNR